MMHSFTVLLKKRGWKSKEVAERWGISTVRISQIAAKPSQLHFDAVNGLPFKESESERREKAEKCMADLRRLMGLDD